MALDANRVRSYLKSFQFEPLFIEELGWDKFNSRLEVSVDDRSFRLSGVAHKRGFAAYVCQLNGQRLTVDETIRKIETQVAKSVHEHLIIYIDGNKREQVWQWAKRQTGKPIARRHCHFNITQSGDLLIQKLQTLVFSLEDEEDLTITDVTGRARAAFDVEKVTKKFYDRFQKIHDGFLEFIKGIPDDDLQRWYASVMLNRLMFIYFIQKKGFLDGDMNYMANKLDQSKRKAKDRYYGDFLCPLFFEGFAKPQDQRTSAMNKLLGNVPYLNGGIFQKHQIEELHGKTIAVPDKAFERIFDFFEEYDWHLDDRPTKNDREINPDVLGYIFEKYINQKQMGAYYTKPDITGYISQNTVIPRLFDMAKEKCKIAFEGEQSVWRLLKDNPDRYIYDAVTKGADLPLPDNIACGLDTSKPDLLERRKDWKKPAPPECALPTEIWREVVARRKRYEEVKAKLTTGEVQTINDLITYNLDIRQFAQDVVENCEGPELLRAFWRAIVGRIPRKSNGRFEAGISILDPTCGSGAFLFAALNILEPLYEACLERMQLFVDDLERNDKKHSPEKFRDFKKILAEVDKHPNPKYFIYKSIIINNLFGVDIMDEAIEICKLRLFLKLVAQVDTVERIEPLPDIDFNIRAGNTLVGFVTLDEVRKSRRGQLGFTEAEQEIELIEEEAQIADNTFQMFRRMQTQQNMSPKDFAEAKSNLSKKLEALEDKLNSYLGGVYNIDAAKKNKYAAWLKSHKPFHWFIDFYGIIKNGGFDVIIGNPPYVEYSKVKKEYQIRAYETEPCGNLYAYVIERCFALSRSASRVGMIVQLSAICTTRMEPLQNKYLQRTRVVWASCYDDRPGRLFDGLEHIRATILLSIADSAGHPDIMTTNLIRWPTEARGHLFASLDYGTVGNITLAGSFPKAGHSGLATILAKARCLPAKLEVSHRPSSPEVVYYYRSPLYWIRAMDFLPHFSSEAANRSVHHFKDFPVRKPWWKPIAGCVINSTIFYMWFVAYGNGRNVTIRDIFTFPIPADLTDEAVGSALSALFDKLMADYKKNSVIRKRRDGVEYQEFYPAESKPIIDEIDKVLAKHYGFTEEELDFIINYDIKYRVGIETEDEGDA